MQLGFVSAILPDLSLEEVLSFAATNGFSCVELMCWPVGKAERRYAGVTHLDLSDFTADDAERTRAMLSRYSVAVSALGYYPNPLCPDDTEAAVYLGHLRKVISAAALLGVRQVNTFIGRDPARSVADNWKLFDERWPGIVRHAENSNVRLAIENCPMYFTADEWPGGKNLATSPRLWRELFKRQPSSALGLNYDPSHLVWQMMDPYDPVREFAGRIQHVHAKDVRIDRATLDDVGIMAHPLEYHRPTLPGLGEIDWGRFFSALGAEGYRGPVCIEVEDRAYEADLGLRQAALLQSARFLRQFLPT